MGAAGEAHAAFGGRVGRGTQGTEEGLLPPSAAGVALVQLELVADDVLAALQRRRQAHGASRGDLRTGRVDLAGQAASTRYLGTSTMGTLPGIFSVLVAPPKQARAARPGAPQAPQWSMHTPSWASDRPTASRCSVVGFVTPPHRAAAGGPPAPRPGALRRPRMAVADRDELWEVKCQYIYIVETNHMHNISQSS